MNRELEPGHILDGRFEVAGVINRGGMASIFQAADLRTGQTVALKVPYFQYECDPGFFERFQREEAILQLLDHPAIVHVLKIDEPKSRPYIAVEYLEGQTLRRWLHSVRRVPLPRALDIASRMCEALDHMHRHQVVHRDLKPENVMLCKDGTLRIMDFGIAGKVGMNRLTFMGFSSAMGTPDYMAPEQVKGKRGDARTDIYGLGAVLYEMLTESAPYEGLDPYLIMSARLVGDPVAPRKVNPAISPVIEEIILHAMERDPHNRYPTAAAMKAELQAPETVQVTGRCERLKPPVLWRARWRMVRVAVFSFLLPILIFGLLWLVFRHR